jgi:hypothetical protein
LLKATTRDNITTMSSSASARARGAAIATLLATVAASAGAQDSTRVTAAPDSLAPWYRDPHTAQTLGSFIPGAGHIYAGEKLRGFGLGAAALVGIASGIVFLDHRECELVAIDVESCRSGVSSVDRINGITQIAVGIAAWVFGAIDAPRAARRENEKARLRVSVGRVLHDGPVRHPALGLGVTVGW